MGRHARRGSGGRFVRTSADRRESSGGSDPSPAAAHRSPFAGGGDAARELRAAEHHSRMAAHHGAKAAEHAERATKAAG